MADKKLCSVYGVVELSNIAAVRTGEIVNQYAMTPEQLENGMLAVVNHGTRTVDLPKATSDVVYLVASVEKEYEGRGRKHFVNKKGTFLPRLYKLGMGDVFETNAVIYDGSLAAKAQDLAAKITEDKGFGIADTTGYIRFVEEF